MVLLILFSLLFLKVCALCLPSFTIAFHTCLAATISDFKAVMACFRMNALKVQRMPLQTDMWKRAHAKPQKAQYSKKNLTHALWRPTFALIGFSLALYAAIQGVSAFRAAHDQTTSTLGLFVCRGLLFRSTPLVLFT